MKKNKNKDPLAQAARLLNENAPEGESLAYINSEEAAVLVYGLKVMTFDVAKSQQ